MATPLLSVSDFISLTNQTLEYAYSSVSIEGEVAGFKVNQSKYVFFDLKDEGGSISCFMSVWQLRLGLEDGMRVVVTAMPKLTNWGKFSLTVREIRPVGEGNLKKSFELLKRKLEAEGLFAPERKRLLPSMPQHIAVISSTQAAGYADFVKIVNDRWGGLQIDVAQVQVQGKEAPDQIIRALRYFNSQEVLPEVIVLIRGGGSADDLSAFNDELLVREIAASRVPTLVGVGHETDDSLADLAADVRAATPSNAAQLVVPDKMVLVAGVQQRINAVLPRLAQWIEGQRQAVRQRVERLVELIERQHDQVFTDLRHRQRILSELDPSKVLARGYAIVRGQMKVGASVEVETVHKIATMEVIDVASKE